jgi:hypothetical protein
MFANLLVVLICGKTGWSIEVEDVEYVLSRTLVIDRLSNLHEYAKIWYTETSFMHHEAENEVGDVARKVSEFIRISPIRESQAVEQILDEAKTKNEDWLGNLFVNKHRISSESADGDDFMPQGDDSNRFVSLVQSIKKFIPSLSIRGISTDMFSHKKIGKYLERSIYNDMFDMIRRSEGEYPLDRIRLKTRSQLATALLEKTTFELIHSDKISIEKKKLVINGLLEVAFKNALNQKFFSNLARGRSDISGNYVGKQIVEFSRIVEGLVGPSELHAKLRNARRQWLQKPKDLI